MNKRSFTTSPSPPPYSGRNDSGHPLRSAAHGLELEVSNHSFHPGGVVLITVTCDHSVLASLDGDLVCTLRGISEIDIMGKSRYQAGQIMNAGVGGALMPIVAHEQHTFASSSIDIPVSHFRSALSDAKNKTSGPSRAQVELPIPSERTCSCSHSTITQPGWGVLPSTPVVDEQNGRTFVRWKSSITAKRKGFLKRSIKLAIAIPVTIPKSMFPSPVALVASKPLAVSINPGKVPTHPELSVNLSIPPTDASHLQQIRFQAVVSTEPKPSFLSTDDVYPSGKLQASFAIVRQVWTSGVDQAKVGDKGGFHWPSMRVATIAVGKSGAGHSTQGNLTLSSASSEGLVFDGVFDADSAWVDAVGCGLSIQYLAHFAVSWDRLKSPLEMSIPLGGPGI